MKKYYKLTILIMAILLVGLILGSVALGRFPISVKELFGILGSKFFRIRPFWTPSQESLLLYSRLPRILMAVLVGCSLSTAGASYQGVFQNPMAAPDLLGASSGAAFGAALAILLNLGNTFTMIFAFIFGIITVLIVVLIGNSIRGKRALSFILAGIMVSSLASSGVSFIKLVADPTDQLPAITYWLMGSLNGIMPRDLLFAVIPMAIGLIALLLLRWRINILTLGDEEARTIGVNTKALRIIVIAAATLVTSACVAVSGIIGWVGLVIPHIARKVVGDDYKKLLPASMLMGSFFLLVVDDLSRCLFTNEIPIGILTSLVGAPFFIYLIVKDGNRS
ncbi:MAG: iron ABC transporter permease [Lachnospiraceae bacterium]|nr:iron ABC transporter permease [Lachnospiraceae bacterium]